MKTDVLQSGRMTNDAGRFDSITNGIRAYSWNEGTQLKLLELLMYSYDVVKLKSVHFRILFHN